MPLSSRDVLFVLRAQDFASREVRNLGTSFGVLGRQVDAAKTQFIKTSDAIKTGMTRELNRLKDDMSGVVQAYRMENKELAKTNASRRNAIAQGQIQASTAARYRKEIARNNLEIAKNNVLIEQATQKHANQATEVRRGAAAQTAAAKAARDASLAQTAAIQARAQGLIATGATMAAIGAVMGVVGTAGVAAMTRMTLASAEFRQGIALAQTQAEDIGGTIDQLQDQAYGVAAAIPVPLEETAEGLYDIYSSMDVTLSGGRRLLEEYSRAAVAGQVDLQDAGRATTAVLNAWQLGAEGVNDVNDIMFRLVERGIGTYGEFATSIGRAIPAAVRAGQEFETLGAAMAFLTRRGLSTEQAATAAARAMELLADPRVVERLQEQGFTLTDMHGNFVPLVDIMRQMSEAWGHLPAPERAERMLAAFGGAGYRIQARRFFDTVLPNFQAFNTEIDRMTDREGATRRAYNTMFAQPQSQIQLLKNNWQILRNEMGEQFFGVLNKIVGGMIDVVKWFQELDDSTLKVIGTFVTISSVVIGLSGVILALAGAAKLVAGAFMLVGGGQILAGIAGLSAKVAILGSTTLGWAAILTGPVGIALAGLAVGVTAAVVLFKRLEDQTQSSSQQAKALAESVGATWAELSELSDVGESAGAQLARFREENNSLIKELKELDVVAKRAKLIEVGVMLSQRTGMTPEEIMATIQQLAQDVGITLSLNFDDLQVQTAVNSVTQTVTTALEGMSDRDWGIGLPQLDQDLNAVKESITDVAQHIQAELINAGGDPQRLTAVVEMWRGVEQQWLNSGMSAEMSAEAINFLADEITKANAVGTTGIGSDLASSLALLARESRITEDDLAILGFALDDTGTQLIEVSADARATAVAAGELPPPLLEATDALEAVEEAAVQLTDAQKELQSSIAGFFDPVGTYTDMVREMAEASADATKTGKDSWKDFADSVVISMDQYSDALEEQITAQQEWEANLIAAAERGGYEFAQSLAAQGPEIAGIVAQLGDASDEEFNRLVALFTEQGRLQGDEYAIALDERLRIAAGETEIAGQTVAEAMEAAIAAQTAGSDTGQGFVVGLNFWMNPANRAGVMIGREAVAGMRAGVNARSPSRDTMEIGKDVVDGFVIGVLSNVSKVHDVMAGPFNAAITAAALLPAFVSGVSSKAVEAAIKQVEDLTQAWENQVKVQEDAAKRADLVSKINEAQAAISKADKPEAREKATESYNDAKRALEEFDRAQARSAEQTRIAAQIQAAEHRLRIVRNREQWYFDAMTTRQQLANLAKRIGAEEKYSDEWMSLMRDRRRLLDEIAADEKRFTDEIVRLTEEREQAAEQEYEAGLAELNRMLDERNDIMSQMSQREEQYALDTANAHRDYSKAVRDAQEAATRAVKDAVAARRSGLESEFRLLAGDESMARVGDLAKLADAQNQQMQEWHQGLLELQRRGMSDEVMKALGIADSPKQLEAVRRLLSGSVEEIDRLNMAIADRQAMLNDIVTTESNNTMFELSHTISQTHADLASQLETMQADHLTKLRDMEESFNRDMETLRGQLQAIGQDHGRTYSEAIAEGIASGIPGIQAQVDQVKSLLRDMKAAQAAASSARSGPSNPIAAMRAALGLAADPASDRIWQKRLAAGTADYAEIQRRLEQKARSFDSGGVWPSGMLGVNRSGKDEYVFTKDQLASRTTTVTVEEGAFQFNGPVDSATIPEVKRMFDEFITDLADELRSN